MPSVGWSEMLMLAVVAIVVVGPKELPRLMRVVGHWMAKARAAASEFQQAFDDLARESEIDEMRRKMDDLRNPRLFSEIDDTGYPTDYDPDEDGEGVPASDPDADGDGERTAPPAAESGNGDRTIHAQKNDNKDGTAPSGEAERAADEPETRTVASQ